MDDEVQFVDVEAVPFAAVRATIAPDEIASFFDRSFGAVSDAVASQGRHIVGPATAFYPRPPGDTFELTVGFPVDCPIDPVGDVQPSELPAGRVARTVHRGGYDGLGNAWQRFSQTLEGNGHTGPGAFWEVYVTKPTPEMDPAELITELNYLLTDS